MSAERAEWWTADRQIDFNVTMTYQETYPRLASAQRCNKQSQSNERWHNLTNGGVSLPTLLRMGIDVMPPKDTEERHKPRLLHESLNQIPQGPRFGISGALCNVIFIAGFNACVEAFESDDMPASRIYSLFYCAYIPVGHAINSLLVFGWPEKYLPSLMSNAPIGLTAMMLGTILTGYFDRIGFEHIADQFLINIGVVSEPEPDEERSEFYSSIVVMIITGVWSYLLSMWVNAAPSKKKLEGKEL